MSLKLVDLCSAISDLSVKGVTIMDADQIPVANVRKAMLFPEPVNFVTNYRFFRDSFGADQGMRRAEYDLTYTYCHVPIGAGRTGLDQYDEMLTNVALIMDEIHDIATIDGAVDVTPADTIEFGAVPDPSGNMYMGCKIVLHVVDFLEVA